MKPEMFWSNSECSKIGNLEIAWIYHLKAPSTMTFPLTKTFAFLILDQGSNCISFPTEPGRKFEKIWKKNHEIMSLPLFLKKETGEGTEFILITHWQLCLLFAYHTSCLFKWRNRERVGVSNLLRIKMLMNCKFRVWKLQSPHASHYGSLLQFLWASTITKAN